jgi:putative hydrolase of the HAD superfamily
MIKAIIFDFGGPIVSWDSQGKTLEKDEDHRNLERDTLKNIFKQYFYGGHVGDYEDLEDFCKKTNLPIEITAQELNEMLEESNSTMRVRPEIIEYIQELKKTYKVAVLSNFTAGLQPIMKDIFNIYHLFDVVVSSYDVKMQKPDPRIYQHALEQLGVKPEEAVFTDDLEVNVAAAEALGIRSILFNNSEQFKADLGKILG